MVDASGDDSEQCIALTKDGSRCTRPAQEDGFCYQHDESSDTIDLDESPADEGADAGGDQPADESTPEIAADDSGAGESTESSGGAAAADASPDVAADEGAADDDRDEAGGDVDHDEIEGVIDPEEAADGDEATATTGVAADDGSAGRSGPTDAEDDAGPARAAAVGGPATGDLVDDLRDRAVVAEAWARRTGRKVERHARRAYREGRVRSRDLAEKTRETVTPMVESAREEYRRLRARVAKELSTYRK